MIVLSKFELVIMFAGLILLHLLRHFKPRFTKSIPEEIFPFVPPLEYSKPYGEPFVIRPDEYRIEQEQKKKQAKREKGFENIKDFVKRNE